MRGFRQFDAPVCMVVTYDKELQGGDIAQFDCSALVNGLVTAAWSKGLGAVVNSQGIMQAPVVREHAGIPDDQVIMICVAMGYPDDSFPANEVVSRRRAVDEVASFVGFD
jgi:nitroreductase